MTMTTAANKTDLWSHIDELHRWRSFLAVASRRGRWRNFSAGTPVSIIATGRAPTSTRASISDRTRGLRVGTRVRASYGSTTPDRSCSSMLVGDPKGYRQQQGSRERDTGMHRPQDRIDTPNPPQSPRGRPIVELASCLLYWQA